MNDIKAINAEGLGRLPAFSHATVAGDLIFVSGTLGTMAGSFELAEGGTGAQTTQTLENIKTILTAAGATLRRFRPSVGLPSRLLRKNARHAERAVLLRD